MSLANIIQAGFWPGNPTADTFSYVFDQQLFFHWHNLQMRMPGTSEKSFVAGLEDMSSLSGRVSYLVLSFFFLRYCKVKYMLLFFSQ